MPFNVRTSAGRDDAPSSAALHLDVIMFIINLLDEISTEREQSTVSLKKEEVIENAFF